MSGKRVLSINIEPSYFLNVEDNLRNKGINFVHCKNSADAFAWLMQNPDDFSVIILGRKIDSVTFHKEVQRKYPWMVVLKINQKTKALRLETDATLDHHLSWPDWGVRQVDIGNQIQTAVAIGNERYQHHRTEILLRCIKELTLTHDEFEFYHVLHQNIEAFMPHVDGVIISVYDADENIVRFPYSVIGNQPIGISQRDCANGVTEFVLSHHQSLLLKEGDTFFRKENSLDDPSLPFDNCASEIIVPLRKNNFVLGTIGVITFDKHTHYTQAQLDTLEKLAEHCSAYISNIHSLEETKLLRHAASELARTKGKEDVIAAIVDEAHKFVSSDFTGLMLVNNDGLLFKSESVIPKGLFQKFDNPRQAGGLTRFVVDTKKPLIIRDTLNDDRVKEQVRQYGIRSMLALPLIHHSKVLGVLFAHSKKTHHFLSRDVDLWTTFAIQAAAALDRAIEEDEETNDFKRLANGLGKLSNGVGIIRALQDISNIAQDVFVSDSCRIAYFDAPTGKLIRWCWSENSPQQYRFEGELRPDGVTLEIFKSQQPIICSGENINRAPNGLLKKGLRSFASLPLVANQRTIGIIHCNYFNQNEKASPRLSMLLDAYGTKSAMALESARLQHNSECWKELDKTIITSTTIEDLCVAFTETALDTLHADFAVFYPYNPASLNNELVLLRENRVVHGQTRNTWVDPTGGMGGGVHQGIRQAPNGFLIVNDIFQENGKYISHLSDREDIRAFVAVRLEVRASLTDKTKKIAGLLFLNYRNPTNFEPEDLGELQHAGNLVATSILRLTLERRASKLSSQHQKRLRAFLNIFQDFKASGNSLDLNLIAKHTTEAFNADLCTIVEYREKEKRFSDRGAYGLLKPNQHYTISPKYEKLLIESSDYIEITDTANHPITKGSEFVRREKVRSSIIYPLSVEGNDLGLLFINFREVTCLAREEKVAIGMFATLTAIFLHQERLGKKLDQKQRRLDRRLFLDWVSMIEATWRHSIVQKTASIQNYIEQLKRQLNSIESLPADMIGIPEVINNIYRIANDVADAPPRVPQSWEMEKEVFEVAPLLEMAAERERLQARLRDELSIEIIIDSNNKHLWVKGFKRWLVYALEALLMNARKAMPDGGQIILNCQTRGEFVEIRVIDQGVGIPDGIRKEMFSSIIQSKDDTSGMGIGSLLVAIIVEEHEGKVAIEKTDEQGTTILIQLPTDTGTL